MAPAKSCCRLALSPEFGGASCVSMYLLALALATTLTKLGFLCGARAHMKGMDARRLCASGHECGVGIGQRASAAPSAARLRSLVVGMNSSCARQIVVACFGFALFFPSSGRRCSCWFCRHDDLDLLLVDCAHLYSCGVSWSGARTNVE